MNILDSFFLSVNYEVFFPQILTYIKNYLKCEQVFISQLNSQGEQENIIDFQGNIFGSLSQYDRDNYEIYKPVVDYLNELKNGYYTHQDKLTFNDDTTPLKRAELAFPLIIKTPEIKNITNIKIWGILFIYDYNYMRAWTEEEIKDIEDFVNQLMIGIERNILYKKLVSLQEELNSCEILDEVTGLAKYQTFIDCLDYELRRLAREKQPLSLILIEINNSDNLSNEINKKISLIIQEQLKRPTDLGATYHDNQLIILLPNTDNNGALWIQKMIVKRINQDLKKNCDFDCYYSIITKIPLPDDKYSDLLLLLELPLHKKKNSKTIYNQNLIEKI
ncbi:diguanylate cyclase domain-containing protein [Geminocystis sp. CENA526]|uniref:sensor domain-containing diguanylate cyclase n=1 Tax=Geminocystis sp. CENA526 TaxID=1355871 RepID=UPI003D6E3616